jgi:hypothetical protein
VERLFRKQLIKTSGYGTDQRYNGKAQVFCMQPHHSLHEAQQEKSEGKTGAQQVLPLLPEEQSAH